MPSRDIKDCALELQTAWGIIRPEFVARFPGWDMILTCTHRTPEEQFDLYKKGRTLMGQEWIANDAKSIVTHADGTRKLSMHNYYPSKAFDVALKDPEGRLQWNNGLPQWRILPELATLAEVVNGGSWKHFTDYPHFELHGRNA